MTDIGWDDEVDDEREDFSGVHLDHGTITQIFSDIEDDTKA